MTAVLEIDLDHIAANWRDLRDRHAPGLTAAVVKADGYGLGAPPVVRRLHEEGCRHFFVAHLAEALAVKPSAPVSMVAVLNGIESGMVADFVRHDIAPVLNSLADIVLWRDEARRHGRVLPALLHIDTGINRLGLDAAELNKLTADPGQLDGIRILFIMTHLASSELPAHPENQCQVRRFHQACARLPAAPRSIAASSGIFLGPDFRSNLARPGAALFGVNPTPAERNPMRIVATLRAQVLQVRQIGTGERVGYNGVWRADRPSRIATVGVGYADGYSRHLSNQGSAAFDGATLPLVGRVSMDLTTFDVTDHPMVQSGSWLELMGPHVTPDALATLAGTNGYEILTSLGRRYTRRYTRAAA